VDTISFGVPDAERRLQLLSPLLDLKTHKEKIHYYITIIERFYKKTKKDESG